MVNKHPTIKLWVEKMNVPLLFKETGDLKEWRYSVEDSFGGNRWKKVWHDHIFVQEHKDLLTNILLETKEVKSMVRDLLRKMDEKNGIKVVENNEHGN